MLEPEILALHDGILEQSDPLKLELEDDEFVEVITNRVDDSIAHYKAKNLYARQDKNVDYYLGRQYNPLEIPKYQKPFVENVVYEALRRIKPIATSRLPDMTVKPGNLLPDTKTNAENLTELFNGDLKKRANRKLFGLSHIQEQLYFYAVVKARWNTEKGLDGDYEFINVHPQNIVWDHTCRTNNADDMIFVAENAEVMVKELMMMFPNKADDLLKHLGYIDDKRTDKNLSTKIKIWEVWFHWYKEVKDDKTQKVKWEKINAVVWKYGNFILGKMRNPYFDYEGKVHLFSKEMKEKGKPSNEEIEMMLNGTMSIESDTVYYNYFKNPRKPYFFMVYESLGNDPIDATNRVEQILLFQDHINQEGTQIIAMNERSAGKPIFNGDALDAKTVDKIDWQNFRQAISVKADDLREAFAFVQMPAAPQQLYQSKSENRSIAFEMMGVGATTRGVKDGDQTLGESQMFREADYGFIDDLVEETINELAEWMAQWSMQFIRVFYTQDHMRDIAGKDGQSLYQAINQDMVEDGMIVEVSASGVDKLQRKRLAIENMKNGVGDILSYYEDTEQNNPKERALRAMMYKFAPQMYIQKYLMSPIKPGETPPGPMQDAPPPGTIPPAGGTVPPVQPPVATA